MERRGRYQPNYPPCEAPIHVEACSGFGKTDDHFTPQCVEKLSRIKDTPENHQRLSVECHREKDASTPMRAELLRQERRGIIYSWEEHRKIFAQWQIEKEA
jgi:hypothetical protein